MRWLSILVAITLGTACGSNHLQRRTGHLEVDPDFVDFGAVATNQSTSRSVSLRNDGVLPVQIESLQIIEDDHGAFSVAGGLSMTLVSGASVVVEVTYRGGAVPSTDVAFLKIVANADDAPALLVNLKGRTTASGTLDEAGGNVPPDGGAAQIPTLLSFGGLNSSGTSSNDVWGFDPQTRVFTKIKVLTPVGSPASRYGHLAAWDATTSQMLVFGGAGAKNQTVDQEFWALDFKTQPPTWTKLQTSGVPPTPRQFVNYGFDASNRSLYVFSGHSTGTINAIEGLYKFDVASRKWTQILAINEPKPRSNAATVFEPATGSLIVAGGYDQGAPTGLKEYADGYSINLRVPNPEWTLLPALPQTRLGGSLWLSLQGLELYGGASGIQGNGPRVNHGDVLRLTPGSNAWVVTPSAGSPPDARYLAATATVGAKRYVFGGGYLIGVESAIPRGDLWEFDTATVQWTQLAPADAPNGPGPTMAGTLVSTR